VRRERAFSVVVDQHALGIHFPMVAFTQSNYLTDFHSTYVSSLDIRNGRVKRRCFAGAGSALKQWPEIPAIVVAGNGGIAWSARHGNGESASSINSWTPART
jgi:hypothetical protein